MKPTTKSKTGSKSGTSAASKGATASGSATAGQRGAGSTGNKNSKESFQKKLLICQKTYDYKDESKDVKGKTERLNAINEI
tara:strand:- start:279 stop:521 length:243 start_codon:yes stop_codon:yes gene_type:complete